MALLQKSPIILRSLRIVATPYQNISVECDRVYSVIFFFLWCVAVCCQRLHCISVCCSVLQCKCAASRVGCHRVYSVHFVMVCCCVLSCVAVCCSVLQCNTVPCIAWRMTERILRDVGHGVLQFVAVCCQCFQCEHIATHCNTLQHTATRCNTLQRTDDMVRTVAW